MDIREVRTMHRRSFWLAVKREVSVGVASGLLTATHLMMRRRSLQSLSPALADRTNPAAIAASRIIWHPVASQAAGTVSHTSAESVTKHKGLRECAEEVALTESGAYRGRRLRLFRG